jgi:hypothetical protein
MIKSPLTANQDAITLSVFILPSILNLLVVLGYILTEPSEGNHEHISPNPKGTLAG